MKIKEIIKGLNVVSQDIGSLIQREVDFIKVKPKTATAFLTYRCNSRCKTCTQWKRPQEEEKKKELDFKKWKLIADKLEDAGIKVIEIFGGNVLLRKDLLIPLLKHLREKGFGIHLPTNQIGLDNEILDVMADCVDALYISIDGVGEHQELIRGQKGAFQRAENTIAKLVKLREQKNKYIKRIICNTTVSKYNIDNLDEIAAYAVKSGFDEMHFELCGEMTQEDVDNSMINGLKPAVYYLKQDESILLNHKNAVSLHDKLMQFKKKYQDDDIIFSTINIDGLSVRNIENGTIPHDKCYVERYEVTLDPLGNVVGCPFFNNYIIGNLTYNSFDTIWNNEKHRRFRKFQNSGKFAICKHCVLGIQRNPSMYTSMKRIYNFRIKDRLHGIKN